MASDSFSSVASHAAAHAFHGELRAVDAAKPGNGKSTSSSDASDCGNSVAPSVYFLFPKRRSRSSSCCYGGVSVVSSQAFSFCKRQHHSDDLKKSSLDSHWLIRVSSLVRCRIGAEN